MNLLEKLKLTKQLDEMANAVLSGELPLMKRIQTVRQIDEIIARLSGESGQPEKKSFVELVKQKQTLGVRLKDQYSDMEKQFREYFIEAKEDKRFADAFFKLFNAKVASHGNRTVRDLLAESLERGAYVQWRNGGPYMDYLKKPELPIWQFLAWLYDNGRLITGDKAVREGISDNGEMFNLEGDVTTADQDFEAEAKTELVDPPVDEAGAFYQAVIDGAEVDVDLIQKAIEYAEQDESHYLLPKASQVIKDAVIRMAEAAVGDAAA